MNTSKINITLTINQTDEPSGPFDAKSVSEISIDGVAPASAIHDATGVWMREQPYTPKRVTLALAGGDREVAL